jgi:hypothetical protein
MQEFQVEQTNSEHLAGDLNPNQKNLDQPNEQKLLRA